MSDDDLEALLDGVWRRRRGELLERTALLRDALTRAAAGDAEARDAATAEAHRLTGALGSLGFTELSESTLRVERALRSGQDAGALGEDASAVDRALHDATRRPG